MKFVFYDYECLDELVDIFRDNLATWRHFEGKMNALEISSPESVGPRGSEILKNVPKPLGKL